MKGKRDGRRFILFNDLLVHLPQSRAKSTEAMQVHEYLWPMYLVWLNPIKGKLHHVALATVLSYSNRFG